MIRSSPEDEPSDRSFGRVRQRLLLLVIAALLPLVLAIGVLSFLSVAQQRAVMREAAIADSSEVLEAVHREIRAHRKLVEILTRSPAFDAASLNLRQFHEVASRFVKQVDGWDRVIVSDASMQQLVNTAVPYGTPLPGAVEPQSITQVLESAATIVTDLTGPGALAPDAKPFVTIRAPVIRDGGPRFVVTVLLRPEVFERAITDSHIRLTWRPFLVDGADRIIAAPLARDSVGQRTTQPAINARASGMSDVYAGVAWSGEPVITAFSKSPDSNWSAHISIPAAEYNEPLRRSIMTIGGLLVIASLLFAVFASIARREYLAARAEADALARANRMEALGRMTGGIAHDFNNLLMVVSTGVEMLRKRNTDRDSERFLLAIHNAADRGVRLTRELMSFSRGQGGQIETIEVGLRIASIKSLIRQSVADNIIVDYRLPQTPCFVRVDPAQFDLAIINVVVNARDAMPDGGTIIIAAECLNPGANRKGARLRLSISDTGAGISAKDLPHVFEPFFTTKNVGKGTGLGLSQVYGFCKAHGGAAEISSPPGQGVTVTISLPLAEAPSAPAPAPAPQSTADPAWRAEGLDAVVVDDNDDVRVLTGEVLADVGFRVRYASNGSEALALCEAGSALVVSDIVMPGPVDGVALARTIRARWPDMQVVLMTGYSEATKDAVAAGVPVLAKPFTRIALLEAINTARLDRKKARRTEA
jgi:signal transduction histidine kinase/CheY-like chemotaxis protein